MKIGYPCVNNSIECSASRTFRLRSYSEDRLIATVESNLECLKKMLEYNIEHKLLFLRISSELVPFASHPVNKFSWQDYFKQTFKELGDLIKMHDIRVSMHPDQFVLINALEKRIVDQSIQELRYQTDVLDCMGLDKTARVQIHVGGAYGDKESSMERFIDVYSSIDKRIQSRLVIENDDRLYTVKDCLFIHNRTGIPVLFDNLHHEINNCGESTFDALLECKDTWKKNDGIMMTDYSSQKKGARVGSHTESIDRSHFKRYLEKTRDIDFDIMLEIKDKERSACKAVLIASSIR